MHLYVQNISHLYRECRYYASKRCGFSVEIFTDFVHVKWEQRAVADSDSE